MSGFSYMLFCILFKLLRISLLVIDLFPCCKRQDFILFFFNGLIVFHSVCMYHIFFAHPSAAGHLGWFHILPIMNWALLSIWMLNKQSKIRSISLPNSRTFYRTVMIKNSLSLAQNRQVGQWSRIETSEINSHVYKQIIFSKQARNNPWSKDCVFNEFCWGNSVYACRSTKQDTYLTHYTKTNLQWIKDPSPQNC